MHDPLLAGGASALEHVALAVEARTRDPAVWVGKWSQWAPPVDPGNRKMQHWESQSGEGQVLGRPPVVHQPNSWDSEAATDPMVGYMVGSRKSEGALLECILAVTFDTR
jgi:hypothetical protein